MTVPNQKLLTRKEASAYLNERGHRIAVATLATMATRGDGPEITYAGRFPRYTPEDLDAWMARREVKAVSTSDLRVQLEQRKKAGENPGAQA